MQLPGNIILVILMTIPRNSTEKIDERISDSLPDPAESSKPPKIDTHTFDYIRKPGDNLSILCEGNAPLEWKIPKVKNNDNLKLRIHSRAVEVQPRHAGYMSAVELHIKNISYLCVGFYICHERDNRSDLSSAVYLYVEDEKHLAVRVDDSESQVYTVLNRSAMIPCRPTAPDLEVTLVNTIDGYELAIPLNTLIGDRYYAYKPFEGIMTNDTVQVKDVSLRCYFKRGNLSSFISMRMVVEIQTYFLETPNIIMNKIKDDVGKYIIILRCQVRSYVHVVFEWKSQSVNWEKLESKNDEKSPDIIYSEISVKKAAKYWCRVRDYQQHMSETSVQLIDEEFVPSSNITFSSASFFTSERNIVEVAVSVKSTEVLSFVWYDKGGFPIPFGNSDKYDFFYFPNRTQQTLFLSIKNMTSFKEGNYTLVAGSKYLEARRDIFFGEPSGPTVQLNVTEKYQIHNKPTTVSCMVSGFPEPFVQFSFKPCLTHNCEYTILDFSRHFINDTTSVLTAHLVFTRSGKIKCVASSKYSAKAELELYVTDIQDGFGIQLLDISYHNAYEIIIITIENSISLSCGAYIRNSTQNVSWRRGTEEFQSNSKYTLKNDNTMLSNKIILTIREIDISDEGIYTCILYEVENTERREIKSQPITVYVARHVPPNIIYSNMNETTKVNEGGRLDMICEFGGRPKPTITWYKNDAVLTFSEERVHLNISNNQITFSQTLPQDEGHYKCEATNAFGKISRKTKLILNEGPGFEWYLILIGILMLLVLLSFVTVYIFHIRKKKLEKLLLEAGLYSFEEGRLENFDPALGINDQADLLPYDKSYEFPIQNLVLGERLGAGAFGIVLKGEARKIIPEAEVTIVAVKMVQNPEQTHIKALVSELKILIHLGKHLNVVNLLGACTKNIIKRELLMIVEYCEFGNVHDYLLRHRCNFINQVDPKTGEIDFLVGTNDRKQNASDNVERHSFRGSTGTLNAAGKTNDEDVETRHTFLQDTVSEQVEWENNHWRNKRPSLGTLTTKHLLSWAFQVVRGMEYLVSRRILHGDLAARNILLADHGIVKISDFGLSKRLLKTDSYKKMSDDPLPIKWMAIEAIGDGIFSTQSDVWSFGVLLWEFFSLSETPYPGMEADEKLFTKLVKGYRMDAPAYSTKLVYRMMLECWSANPLSRPEFNKLEQRLGFMLEKSVKQHYIDLNHPYILMNNVRLGNEAVDYMKMASPPNYENFSSAVERRLSQDCLDLEQDCDDSSDTRARIFNIEQSDGASLGEEKLEKLLLEAGLYSFEEGRLQNFDMTLGINDQGERLGAGAFGIVSKRGARKISPEREVAIVAVKMIQNHAQTHTKALVSELKMLVHLGKHLNVVNLLGARTKHVIKSIECWSTNPLSRPEFNKLEQRLGFMLEKSVKQHYIDLNHLYVLMNNLRLGNEAVDYMKKASPPNFENFSSAVERSTSQDCMGLQQECDDSSDTSASIFSIERPDGDSSGEELQMA